MDNAFRNEDFKARRVACLFWSSTFSLICLTVIISLFNTSISFPWTWIYDAIYQLFSIATLLSIAFSIISIGLLVNLIEPNLTLSDCIYSKRYHLINRIFTGRVLKISFLCGLLGGFVAWWMNIFVFEREFTTLFHHNVFNRNIQSLTLSRTFLLFFYFGIFCGFIFGARFFLFNIQNITFCERLAEYNMVSSIYNYVTSQLFGSARISFYCIVCFYPVFIVAISFTEIFLSLLYIDINDDFYGFPSIENITLMFLFAYYIQFSWSVTTELLKLYFSRSLRFPLSSILSSEETVQFYLQNPCNELTKYLVFQRLCEICETEEKSRKMVYSLSELGAHPHLWNLINKTCQRELVAFLKVVNEANDRLIAKGNLPSAVALQRKLLPENLRIRLHVSDLSPLKKSTNEKTFQKKPIIDLALDMLMSLKVVRFFTDCLPFSETVCAFSRCQIAIWCCQTLKYLICSSVDEDEFGVVQKDAGVIITLLCNLNESVGKHLKLSGLFGMNSNYSLSPETDCLYSDSKLVWKMKNSLNDTIFSIVNSFGQDIDAIQTSASTRQFLEPFKENIRC